MIAAGAPDGRAPAGASGRDLVVFEIDACVQITSRVDPQAVRESRHFEADTDEILETLRQCICSRAAAR